MQKALPNSEVLFIIILMQQLTILKILILIKRYWYDKVQQLYLRYLLQLR